MEAIQNLSQELNTFFIESCGSIKKQMAEYEQSKVEFQKSLYRDELRKINTQRVIQMGKSRSASGDDLVLCQSRLETLDWKEKYFELLIANLG